MSGSGRSLKTAPPAALSRSHHHSHDTHNDHDHTHDDGLLPSGLRPIDTLFVLIPGSKFKFNFYIYICCPALRSTCSTMAAARYRRIDREAHLAFALTLYCAIDLFNSSSVDLGVATPTPPPCQPRPPRLITRSSPAHFCCKYAQVRASAGARKCWCTQVPAHASAGARKCWRTQVVVRANGGTRKR